jgi:hypothetical protein
MRITIGFAEIAGRASASRRKPDRQPKSRTRVLKRAIVRRPCSDSICPSVLRTTLARATTIKPRLHPSLRSMRNFHPRSLSTTSRFRSSPNPAPTAAITTISARPGETSSWTEIALNARSTFHPMNTPPLAPSNLASLCAAKSLLRNQLHPARPRRIHRATPAAPFSA